MVNILFTLTISSPAATGGTATPVPNLPAPVPAGTVVGNVAVQPAGWSGGLAITGTDAAHFTIGGASPNYTVVASTILNAGSYSIIIVPTP